MDEDEDEDDIMIIWKCNECGTEREDHEGYNEGGDCPCGGEWVHHGESYPG